MEFYEIKTLNPMQKKILEHALGYCIDCQDEMGAITPNMARDLADIRAKIEKKDVYGHMKGVALEC